MFRSGVLRQLGGKLGSNSVAVKASTGLVGLDVVPNAREVLIELYQRTLSDVKIMPETVFYRQSVEKFTNFRLDVVRKTNDVSVKPPFFTRLQSLYR